MSDQPNLIGSVILGEDAAVICSCDETPAEVNYLMEQGDQWIELHYKGVSLFLNKDLIRGMTPHFTYVIP